MIRYDNVTFLMCLPRSRSAWLASFLKPVAWTMHDPLKQCASIDELGEKIDTVLALYPQRHMFIADTAAVLFHTAIAGRFPNAKYLFVLRDIDDVMRSCIAQGAALPIAHANQYGLAYARAFGEVRARRDFYLNVAYEELDKRLLNAWRFVGAGELLSAEYAEKMRLRNVQVPFDKQREQTDFRKVQKLFSTIGVRNP